MSGAIQPCLLFNLQVALMELKTLKICIINKPGMPGHIDYAGISFGPVMIDRLRRSLL